METEEMDRTMDLLVEKLKNDNLRLTNLLKQEELSSAQLVRALSSLESKYNLLRYQVSAFNAWRPGSWDSHLQVLSLKKQLADQKGATEKSNPYYLLSKEQLTTIEQAYPNHIDIADLIGHIKQQELIILKQYEENHEST